MGQPSRSRSNRPITHQEIRRLLKVRKRLLDTVLTTNVERL